MTGRPYPLGAVVFYGELMTEPLAADQLLLITSGRRWRWLRLGLLGAWVVVLGFMVAVGTREAPWHDLQSSLTDGDVTTVQVVGELEPGSTGYGLAEVRWREGLWSHRTEVMQVSSPSVDTGSAAPSSVKVIGGVGELLRVQHPGLRTQDVPRPNVTSEFFGWTVSPLVGAVAFVTALSTLMLLILGPSPWWATRWAWFWLGTNPVGVVAFLVLSGPTPGVPAPDNPARRLTGGWALLLSLLVGGLTGAALR